MCKFGGSIISGFKVIEGGPPEPRPSPRKPNGLSMTFTRVALCGETYFEFIVYSTVN